MQVELCEPATQPCAISKLPNELLLMLVELAPILARASRHLYLIGKEVLWQTIVAPGAPNERGYNDDRSMRSDIGVPFYKFIHGLPIEHASLVKHLRWIDTLVEFTFPATSNLPLPLYNKFLNLETLLYQSEQVDHLVEVLMMSKFTKLTKLHVKCTRFPSLSVVEGLSRTFPRLQTIIFDEIDLVKQSSAENLSMHLNPPKELCVHLHALKTVILRKYIRNNTTPASQFDSFKLVHVYQAGDSDAGTSLRLTSDKKALVGVLARAYGWVQDEKVIARKLVEAEMDNFGSL